MKNKKVSYTSLGRQLIIERMQASNISIQELAKLTGISYICLQFYLDGKNDINVGDYLAISDSLGMLQPSLLKLGIIQRKVIK